ncbi:hypothetical protein F2Q68_00023993 [Brassica cretica]|uniref:Uncharacterized protein n=1 Tax=Brassica cretica TaxID=69181 RepID=A0A8S9IH57_BRACR|nr:hypothetical protein F2Q68_00023993 [Brassica cretica]
MMALTAHSREPRSKRRRSQGYNAEHPNDEEEVEGIDLHQQRYPWEGSDMDYLYDEVSISLDGLRSIFESRRFYNGDVDDGGDVGEDDVEDPSSNGGDTINVTQLPHVWYYSLFSVVFHVSPPPFSAISTTIL